MDHISNNLSNAPRHMLLFQLRSCIIMEGWAIGLSLSPSYAHGEIVGFLYKIQSRPTLREGCHQITCVAV